MGKKIVILGLGNILLKDEGIGVHIAQELGKRSLPKNIEVIDGGTSSLDILLSAKNVGKLIIIDALRGGEKPGTIYRLCPKDLPCFSASGQNKSARAGNYVSVHQINLLEALTIAEEAGNAPQETVIIGIEPKEIGWGLGVTSGIKQKTAKIINTVLKEVSG